MLKILHHSVAQHSVLGLGRLADDVARSPKLVTHAPRRTPLNEFSARRWRRHTHNIQQTQETNIHALSGIRTCDPSNQAALDLRLRRHGCWSLKKHNYVSLRRGIGPGTILIYCILDYWLFILQICVKIPSTVIPEMTWSSETDVGKLVWRCKLHGTV